MFGEYQMLCWLFYGKNIFSGSQGIEGYQIDAKRRRFHLVSYS